MKQIKKVVLKEATRLSQEEMKLVFGGSSTTEDGSGCYLRCDGKIYFSTDISGCKVCIASGGEMFCKEKVDDPEYETYTCKSKWL